MSVREYLNSIRLDYAAKLLRDELPVEEISRRCGFSYPAYFIRLFRARFHAPDRAFRIQIEHFGGTGVRAEIGIALIGPVEMIPENDVVEAVLADRVAQPGHVVLEILAFQPEAQFDPPCIAPLERADAPHVIGKRVERHPNRRDEVRGITPRRMIRKAEHAIASPDRAPHVLLVFSRCVSATGRMGVKVRFLHSGRQVGRSAFLQRRQN